MATFRSGLKIFSELTLRQSIGRIRSFSEDRKPGSWLPEDQWAVRPPCSTCPDPCARKKPAKPSKSWLSICKDPEPHIPCDIRHNNCPPPPQPKDEPWYAFITKKKPEKPKPPLRACRLEAQREAENPTEEYCEDIEDSNTWPECTQVAESPEPPEPVACERPPAPVVKLHCPTPVDLDLMMWCSRPGLNASRISPVCQSDRMPYEEFRPKKIWKPPPFSLPTKCEAPLHQPFRSNVGRAYLSEYKQIEIPKPLYTRYKSVELEDENFLLCMTDAKCTTQDEQPPSLAMQPPPIKKAKPPPEKPKRNPCPQKPVLVAASRKPVKLKCAPKFKFRPKLTKLIEKKRYRNPCAQHPTCNLKEIEPPTEIKCPEPEYSSPCDESAPKVITGTLTDEPPIYCRNTPLKKTPTWMFMLSKPGSKDTPLVPHKDPYPCEPDWCGETDGLKFYDGQDEGIHPKPPPDPCRRCVANRRKTEATPPSSPCLPCPPKPPSEAAPVVKERFVLMPENYNIRNLRPQDKEKKDLQEASFQEFIDAKTSNVRACSKLYPQMKENILYDLARNCPLPPFDPTKADPPPRRAPQPECPQPLRFYYRRYSTFGPHVLRKPNYSKVLNRMKSEDSSEKCKPKKLVPQPRECPPPIKGPSCNEMELPCCPKARIPPRCDIKRPLPPCKKKLAPKPSYSECAKDPPPCPRITECNAWEKRDTENRKGPSKGRKFSNWAPEQEKALRGKNNSVWNTEGANPDGLMVRGPSYSEYLDLKDRGQSLNKNKRSPHKQKKLFSGKELMLNFVNSTEDTKLRYKSDSQVGRRKPEWGKLKKAQSETENINHSQGNQFHEQKVITALLQDHHTRNDVKLRNLKIDDKAPALAVLAPNEESSFVGSIGSWISALVTAQKNRSQSCPPSLNKGNRSSATYVETVHVDRIMKLTKPFTHTFKSPSYENLCYYPVDFGTKEQKKKPSPFKRLWGRNRNRSSTVFPNLKRQRALSSLWKYESLSPNFNLREKTDSEAVKKTDGDRKGRKALISGKFGIKRLEEYSLPASDGFGGRTLFLKANGSRSGIHNFHTGSGFSCYPATNAVPVSKKSKHRTIKTVSRISLPHRGAATFNLSSTRKPALKRTETKSSSDLVEVKKPQHPVRIPGKKSINTLDAVEPINVKFRQSATSSIVANVKARKEFDSGKIMTCIPPEKLVMSLPLPQKPWIYIDKGYYYNNAKCDVKKAAAGATVMKNKPKKWFHDVDQFQNRSQIFYDKKKNRKDGKDPLKDDVKYWADKEIKRQEVKNMLTRLEIKKNVFKAPPNGTRARQRELHKNDVINIVDNHKVSEKRNGRFEWQHSLFRSNGKQSQNILEPEKSEPVALNETNFMIDVREAQPKVLRPATSNLEQLSKKVTNNVELYDAALEVVQCTNAEDESPKKKKEKKEKVRKPRSAEKVSFPTSLSLEGRGRPLTSAIARPEPKSLQAVHHLRRFSSCTPNTAKQKKSDNEKSSRTRKVKDSNCGCPRCGDKENAEKEKRGEESFENISQNLTKVRKPGPNCPDN